MLAAKEHINELVIVLCDSLDRHNMAHLSDAKTHCIEAGNVWVEANLPVIKEYFSSIQILRWEDDIRNHSTFDKRLSQVRDLCDRSPAILEMRDAMSFYYLHSKRKRFESDYKNGLVKTFDIDAALKSSADYLEEEFAGDMVYYDLTGGLPHIYWGLYIDDNEIFSRTSGMDMAFPKTLPVSSQRHGTSYPASKLPNIQKMKPSMLSELRRAA